MAAGRKIAKTWQDLLIEFKNHPELKAAVEAVTARDMEWGSTSLEVSGVLAHDFVVRWMVFGDLLPEWKPFQEERK
jgi:hypothetical protein